MLAQCDTAVALRRYSGLSMVLLKIEVWICSRMQFSTQVLWEYFLRLNLLHGEFAPSFGVGFAISPGWLFETVAQALLREVPL